MNSPSPERIVKVGTVSVRGKRVKKANNTETTTDVQVEIAELDEKAEATMPLNDHEQPLEDNSPQCTCNSSDANVVDLILDKLQFDVGVKIIQNEVPPNPATGEAFSHEKHEALSFLYLDNDGYLRASELFSDYLPGNVGQIYERIYSLGISPNRVLGLIHNHPVGNREGTRQDLRSAGIPGTENFTNSQLNRIMGHPSFDDWDLASNLVNSRGADSATFRLYVIGPDRQTKEYYYSDKERWKSDLLDPSKAGMPADFGALGCPVHAP